MTQPVRRYTTLFVDNIGEPAKSVESVDYTDYLALEAERDQLRHECARLGAEVSALDGLLGTALAERDALRADARRYQFLRAGGHCSSLYVCDSSRSWSVVKYKILDAAIDSALATQEAG